METQEQVERENKINGLIKRLSRDCKDRYVLEEAFDITGDKRYILQAIEVENPSRESYPKCGAMGGCSFGIGNSSTASHLAEKIGDTELAVRYMKEAIARLEVFRKYSSQGSYGSTRLRSWSEQDEQELSAYQIRLGKLLEGKLR
jgi:hypothetical protein